MTDAQLRTEIRSFRAVFDLERRIYRIDRLRLNPAGVPLRGIAYAVVLLAVVLVVSRVPIVGWPLRALPWHVRDVAVPVGLAVLATMVRADGRALHVAARSLVRHVCSPRRVARFAACRAPNVWRPPQLVLIPDGSQPVFRRARFTGPGAVLVRRSHTRSPRGHWPRARLAGRAGLTLTEAAGASEPTKGEAVLLGDGVRLDVRRANQAVSR